MYFNSLSAELNPICHLLALLDHHILHVSRIRVNVNLKLLTKLINSAFVGVRITLIYLRFQNKYLFY